MSFGTLHLGPALVEFMRRYPSVHVQLTLSDRFVDPLTDGFDITVRIAERIDSPSLIDHDIVRIDRILCAAPSLLERCGEPRSLTELAVMPCLHYGDLPSGGRWRLSGPEGTIDLKVEGVLCSNNAEVLCQAAADGLGVALLPTFIAAEEIRAGRLVPILNEFSAPKLFLRLIYPPNRHLSARIRVFVRFMQDRFGDDAQWAL
jgi:DNA-binding transcriptional LysR family regulator